MSKVIPGPELDRLLQFKVLFEIIGFIPLTKVIAS